MGGGSGVCVEGVVVLIYFKRIIKFYWIKCKWYMNYELCCKEWVGNVLIF